MELTPALPASWYHSSDHYQHERREIFAREWLVACPAHRLENPGDFVTVEIAGYPLVLVRDMAGVLRGFHNVCRHRASPVVTAEHGNLGRTPMTCGYHGWSYGADGDLLSVPHLGRPDGAQCRRMGLLPIGVGTLGGLVFVNIDGAAPPLDDARAPLIDEIHRAGYDLGRYQYHSRVVREGAFNWKVWVEGYQECYHCPTIHPVFNKDFALREYRVENRERFSVHACPRRAGSVSGEREGLWLWAYPNLGLPCYELGYYALTVHPLSATRTRLLYDFHFAPGAPDAEVASFLAFVTQITDEDISICERVQRNLEAGVFTHGYLHPERENGVAYFHELLRRPASKVAQTTDHLASKAGAGPT